MTARVPFALVGVLLLVSSAAFAGSLGGPTVSEPSVDRAMDRTESATQSIVREAVTTAATEAARNPVTVPAATPVGEVIGDTNTFRNALRVRIYADVRDRLDRIERHRDGVTVDASLPATPSGSALEDAIDRVSITRAGKHGTDLRATIENVTLTARRGDQTVGERIISPTVTVPVPTLAVHDRVSKFERRLNAGPEESGLGSRLTSKLYALTWTRGYAQFGGAPIENVVANRHLSLLTNSIALSMQQEHFGRSDPRGRSILSWATAHTAITDALSGSTGRVAAHLSKAQQYAGMDTLPSGVLSQSGATDQSVAPDDEITIAVNSTADVAFVELLDRLNDTIDRTYDARAQLRQRVVNSSEHVVHEPREPGPNWELVGVSRSEKRSVTNRAAQTPELDGPWHLFEHHPRRVSVRTRIERRWNTTDGQQTTVEIRERRGDVDVILAGRHDGGSAPVRPVETVHESGGPLDGPNLKRVASTARSRLVGNRNVDDLAVQAIQTGGKTTTISVRGQQPDGLYQFVYSDLRWIRERVRDVSITTTRGELATFQTNPGRRLAEKLQNRWDDLLAAPGSYGSVADRARFNARVAYLRAVLSKLHARAEKHSQSREKIDEELSDREMRSLGKVQDDYDSRGVPPVASSLGLQMRVETAPSYLTLGKLDGKSVPTLPPGETTHPLVARNVNFFTTPYGDVAQKLTKFFLGPNRVRLSTAVQALEAARKADGETASDVSANTDKLESKVESAVGYLGGQATVAIYGATPAGRGEASAIVSSALEQWQAPVALGNAWLNGSAVQAIHDEVGRRYDLSDPRHDKLKLGLRAITRVSLASDGAQPPLPVVNETVRQLQGIAKQELAGRVGDKISERVESGLEKVTGKTLSRLPAGLPLAPPVAPWVTTVNYWETQVRGEYTRFTVSVPRGTPDSVGARFKYVRDSGTVSLDVDGDGTTERLGRTTRVSFRTHTSVAIAVPPKPRGVGDVDGVMDERSAGWPRPG